MRTLSRLAWQERQMRYRRGSSERNDFPPQKPPRQRHIRARLAEGAAGVAVVFSSVAGDAMATPLEIESLRVPSITDGVFA